MTVGGRSGREDPHFGGNIHHSYHLLLGFGSQFHLKIQCCFFPLLSFEEKLAAGPLPCSARSCYEPFSKRVRVRRGVLLERASFLGDKERQQGQKLAFSSQKEAAHTLQAAKI